MYDPKTVICFAKNRKYIALQELEVIFDSVESFPIRYQKNKDCD